MTIFCESPWLIAALGTLLAVMLVAGLVKTGRLSLLWAALGTLALTAGLVALERAIVTTREEVAITLDMIADQMQRGAYDEVLGHIASESVSLRRTAERLLPQLEFHEVRVKRNLQLEIEDPQHLTATFNAVMVVSERNGTADRQHVPSFFKVQFLREGDTWKVTDVMRSDPRDGMGRQR